MARSTNQDQVATLAEQVAALTALVAAMAPAPAIVAPKPTPKGRASKPSAKLKKSPKVYTWKPWACAKFGIPTTVGMTFAYTGKNGTTDHVVTAVSTDGIVSSTRA